MKCVRTCSTAKSRPATRDGITAWHSTRGECWTRAPRQSCVPNEMLGAMVVDALPASRRAATGPKSPVKATRNAEASRIKILDAARIEFVSHGLSGARVDRIAAQSGVNKNLIYHYF